MVKQGRNIQLLINNVSSHSPSLNCKVSNIKVLFLPEKSTSRLQPPDAGIIKVFYCKLLVQHILASIDTSNHLSASAIAKSVDVNGNMICKTTRHGMLSNQKQL